MKVAEILKRDEVVREHTAKIDAIMAKEVDALSISELSFIKRVSAGSITTMKKQGAPNEKILRTTQHHGLSDLDKVKLYLKALPEHERKLVLESL